MSFQTALEKGTPWAASGSMVSQKAPEAWLSHPQSLPEKHSFNSHFQMSFISATPSQWPLQQAEALSFLPGRAGRGVKIRISPSPAASEAPLLNGGLIISKGDGGRREPVPAWLNNTRGEDIKFTYLQLFAIRFGLGLAWRRQNPRCMQGS